MPKQSNSNQSEINAIVPQGWRFKQYFRDKTKRGRALSLAHILDHLRKHPDFEDFAPLLKTAIVDIHEQGGKAERKRERVIAALKDFATEVAEIADETRLEKCEVLAICEQLYKEHLVRRDYRTRPAGYRGNQNEPNRVELFFWRENDEKFL